MMLRRKIPWLLALLFSAGLFSMDSDGAGAELKRDAKNSPNQNVFDLTIRDVIGRPHKRIWVPKYEDFLFFEEFGLKIHCQTVSASGKTPGVFMVFWG